MHHKEQVVSAYICPSSTVWGCVENQSDIRQLTDDSEMPKTHAATNIEYGQLDGTVPVTVASILSSLVVVLSDLFVRTGFSAISLGTSSCYLVAVGSLVTGSRSSLLKSSVAVAAAAGAPVA